MHAERMVNEGCLPSPWSINEDYTASFPILGERHRLGDRNSVLVALKKTIEMIEQSLISRCLHIGVSQVIHDDLDVERGIGFLCHATCFR